MLSDLDIGLVGGQRSPLVEAEDGAVLRGGGGEHVVLSGLATAGRGPALQEVAADGRRIHDAALEGDGGGVGTDENAGVRRDDASGGDLLQFRVAGDQFGHGVDLRAGGRFRVEIQAKRRPSLGGDAQLERLLVDERDVVEIQVVVLIAAAGIGVGRGAQENVLGLRTVVRVIERNGESFPFAVRLGDGHVDGRGHDVGLGGCVLVAVDIVEIVVDGGRHLRVGVTGIGPVRGELHPDDQRVGPAGEGHRAGILEAVQGVGAVPVGIVVILLAGGRCPVGVDTSGREVPLGIRLGDRNPEDLDHHLAGPDAARVSSGRSRTLVRGSLDLAVGGVISVGVITSGFSDFQLTSVTDFEESVFQANGIAREISKQSRFLETIMNILLNYKTIVGLKKMLVYVAESVLIYIAGLFIISKVYLKGAIGTTINSRKTDKEKTELKLEDFKQDNKNKSYIKKELKILARTPIFCIQCLIIPIIYPLTIFLVLVIAVLLSKMIGLDIIANFMGIINTPKGQAIFLGVADVFFMMNFCSIIGVSKDSKGSILIKSIPMGLYRQFNLRTVIGRTINMFSAFIITIAYAYTTKNVLLTVCVFAIVCMMNGIGEKAKLLIDLEKPKINWDNEYTMMKEHTNVMYVLFYTLATLGILFAVGMILKSVQIYIITVLIIYLIANYIINNYIRRNKNKIFMKVY